MVWLIIWYTLQKKHFLIFLFFTNEMKSNFLIEKWNQKPNTRQQKQCWLFYLSVCIDCITVWVQNCMYAGRVCVCVRAFILKMLMSTKCVCLGVWKMWWDCVYWISYIHLSFIFRFSSFSPTDHFDHFKYILKIFTNIHDVLICIMGVCGRVSKCLFIILLFSFL